MQKPDGVEDLRVRRTRKLLTQALVEVTVEKGFTALTVRDITERAMINRSTFYRHYLDKYDLLEQHLQEIYDALEEGGGLLGEKGHEGLIELLTQIQQVPNFYRVMLSEQANAFLSQRFRRQTQQRMLAYFHQLFPQAPSDSETLPPDLTYTTLGSAACSALSWWLEQKQPSPPEQFAHWLQKLIRGISGTTV